LVRHLSWLAVAVVLAAAIRHAQAVLATATARRRDVRLVSAAVSAAQQLPAEVAIRPLAAAVTVLAQPVAICTVDGESCSQSEVT
jgi:hypothetical protein